MSACLEILGALAVLLAFVGVQSGRLATTEFPSLALNAVGGAVLAALALIGQQWGFLLLEGTWAVVAGIGLMRLVRRRRGHHNSPSHEPWYASAPPSVTRTH